MNTKDKKAIFISLILILSCLPSPAFAQGSLSRKITEGNRLYADGKYDKALAKYNDAQVEAPARPEIFFNMGNVFYRQGKYKEAIDSYQKSMEEGGVNIEAGAMYNIGNSFFRQGQLREALEYYKQALDKNPDDVDAKYNIEYTERMIKEMLSKSKETMERAIAEQQKSRMQEEQQLAQAGGEKEEEKADEEEAQSAPMQEGEKETGGGEDKERQGGAEGKGSDEIRLQGAEFGDRKGLSEEDAERFLSAFEREQKNSPLFNQQKSRRGRGYYVEKDW